MSSFSTKPADSLSWTNFSLSVNVDEFCQVLLITCLTSTGPHLGRFVQKSLQRKFPGRLASGEEAWRRRCTAFLPLSVRKHAKLGDDGEWKDVYAILEVTRAYLRSVFLPLRENVVGVSKFEQLEQLNKEVNAVQQCRNWVCHLQPVSVAELTSCLNLFKRLVNRFDTGTNGVGIIAVEIDHCLSTLIWAKDSLLNSWKDNSATEIDSGARTSLKVPDYFLDQKGTFSILLIRSLMSFTKVSVLLLERAEAQGLVTSLNYPFARKEANHQPKATIFEIKELIEIYRGLLRLPSDQFHVSSSIKGRLLNCCGNIIKIRNKLAHMANVCLADVQRCSKDCLFLVKNIAFSLNFDFHDHLLNSEKSILIEQCLHDLNDLKNRFEKDKLVSVMEAYLDRSFPAGVPLTLVVEPVLSINFGKIGAFNMNSRRQLSPLVKVHGRKDDLSKLTSLLTPRTSGSWPKVLLTGPPGIGKTTLALAASAEVSSIYPMQFLLQSSSVEALYSDLITASAGDVHIDERVHDGQEMRRAAVMDILTSLSSSLLVFDDLFDPLLAKDFLSLEKHAALFVTHSKTVWKEQLPTSSFQLMTGSLDLSGLDDDDAYSLLRTIVIRGKTNNRAAWEAVNQHRELIQGQLLPLIENLPLAIHIIGSLIAQELLEVQQLVDFVNGRSELSLTEVEMSGACLGDKHVRGVSGVVELALEHLPKDDVIRRLLYTLAFIPYHRVPVWFLKHVVFDDSSYGSAEQCFHAILKGGLVQKTKIGVCAHVSLSMHKLVQHCILEKWSGDGWAKKLEGDFFIVTSALSGATSHRCFSKQETRDMRALLISVVYKYLDGCLGDVEEFYKTSHCTSVSHVCLPALFLRGMFARACEIPSQEFNIIEQNSKTNFINMFVIAKKSLQAICTGFFLFRGWISTLLGKEYIWSLFFEKLLLHSRLEGKVERAEADFFWKLGLRDFFFEQFLVVQGQLVRSFDVLSQSSYSHSESHLSNNMPQLDGVEEDTSRNTREALCDIICQVATFYKRECSEPEKLCTVVLERTSEQILNMHQPAGGNTTPSNRIESAAETSNTPLTEMSRPYLPPIVGIESVGQRDKQLESFLLSTSSKWSLKTAQELEQCASQILSAWQWDSSAPIPSYADVALAMWSACSTGKYHLAVKILTHQIKLIKNGGIDQWAEIGKALSALSILLYFKGSLEQIVETICTLLLFLSWFLTSFDINKHIPESDTQQSLLQTSEMFEAVESELISYLVACVCKDSLIDDQMASLISMCRSCGHPCAAARLHKLSKRLSEERSTAGKLFLRVNAPKRC